MRGRKPRAVQLKAEDVPVLEALVRSGKTEHRVARRARILLEMDRQERVKLLSKRVEQDSSTVWRVCRRYEKRGIEAVYDAPRSGRPPEISPPRENPG
jgi:transposase